MKSKRFSLPVVGGSSLLTIFAVLCLVVFALLSVSTAKHQQTLSEASAHTVAGYYAADARAEAIRAELKTGTVPADVREEPGKYCYSCPISETQSLEVELDGESLEVLRWQAVSTAPWEQDDSLAVWEGST